MLEIRWGAFNVNASEAASALISLSTRQKRNFQEHEAYAVQRRVASFHFNRESRVLIRRNVRLGSALAVGRGAEGEMVGRLLRIRLGFTQWSLSPEAVLEFNLRSATG